MATIVNGYNINTPSLYKNNRSTVYIGEKNGVNYIIKFYCSDYRHCKNEISIHEKLKKHNDYSKYVIQLIEYFIYKEYTVLVFEKGEIDLFEYVVEYNNKDFNNRLELCIKTIDCVKFIHSQGIIHIDIKSENIVLVKNDNGVLVPKLIDFEFAQDVGNESSIVHNKLMGTEGNTDTMVLEQMKKYNEAVYSFSTDTYTVGVFIYDMLTSGNRFYPPKVYTSGSRLISDRDTIDDRILSILDKVLIHDSPKERLNLSEIRHRLSLIIEKDNL